MLIVFDIDATNGRLNIISNVPENNLNKII